MTDNNVWSIAGRAVAVASLPGTLELALLSAGSLVYRRKLSSAPIEKMARLAIVVPAHNESESIGDCVRSLKRCDLADRLATVFVVADNCSDDTAEQARRAGAQVIVRSDSRLRGKGHALNFAFQELVSRYFDAFVVVDADSEVDENFVEEVSIAMAQGAEAIQCSYLVTNPERNPLPDLALRAFNQVRPRGRDQWGASAGILGNGFALSRQVLERVPYAADSVVEDLEYHIHLVRAGVKVRHLSGTCVRGAMPESEAGRASQRARWEGGRLRMFLEKGPWLVGQILRGQYRYAELLLDLATLPLAYHLLLLAVSLVAMPAVGVLGWVVLLVHIWAAMAVGKSRSADFKALAAVPAYVVWKLKQLPRIIAASGRNTAWVRTARAHEESANA